MDHTTYIEDANQKPDQFELLRIHLGRAVASGKPVYVLTLSTENFRHPDSTAESLKKIPGIYEALAVNGTIDCIMSGTEDEVKVLAEKLHVETGDQIGCVKYSGDNMVAFYVMLKDSISIAREKNEPWHIYNPAEDSLDAIIQKAKQTKQ
jgi:hypothetical protein